MTRRDGTDRESVEVLIGSVARVAERSEPSIDESRAEDFPALTVRLRINGEDRQLTVDPRTTLLDALRDHLQLTGTKMGCHLGQCGACTVLLDGDRIVSCLALAARLDGREVATIEGLARPDDMLHPLQG